MPNHGNSARWTKTDRLYGRRGDEAGDGCDLALDLGANALATTTVDTQFAVSDADLAAVVFRLDHPYTGRPEITMWSMFATVPGIFRSWRSYWLKNVFSTRAMSSGATTCPCPSSVCRSVWGVAAVIAFAARSKKSVGRPANWGSVVGPSVVTRTD